MCPCGRWALVGLIAVVVGGCGTGINRPNTAGQIGITNYAQAAEASCATGEANGKPLKASCVFVLADGRRFSCPPRFARAAQTASSLEHSATCRTVAPLYLNAAVRRLTATIESTPACLTSRSVRAIGNAVLPPLAHQNSADGELIVGHLPDGALIAFYRDTDKAVRLEPGVLNNARRLRAQVERRGAITIFWWRPPVAALRNAVQACLPAV